MYIYIYVLPPIVFCVLKRLPYQTVYNASSCTLQDEMQSTCLHLARICHNLADGVAAFQLFACEDEALLVGWNSLICLNLCLEVVNGHSTISLEPESLIPLALDVELLAILLLSSKNQ